MKYYKCMGCGRSKFYRKWQPHWCIGGFRKHRFFEFVEVVSSTNLTQEFDAKVWVSEWMKSIKNDRSIPTSEGTMLGWFENAIMAGYDKARAELAEWRADAERLTKTFVIEVYPHEWACRGCHHMGKTPATINHAPDCPITLHRDLVTKYGGEK